MGEQQKPLWRVMDAAMSAVIGNRLRHDTWRKLRAAELRAIADEMERRGALGLDLDPLPETADWLRAEADRAENGEVSDG